MQTLQSILTPTTFTNESGHYIKSFLIGTKMNEAGWKIDKTTAHKNVQSFIGKDFAIIPELIFRPLEQGGGGHSYGPKEKVIADYAKNSHGKIVEVIGPISYNDKTDDFYYEAITKLDSSRAASALQEHGSKTWVPFSVSPHIFIDESGGGDDSQGWNVWQGASLSLVIKGAYGNEAVVSKLCNGPHKACKMELMQQRSGSLNLPNTDEQTANHITSLVTRTASTNSNNSMVDTKLSTEQPEPPNNGEEGNGNGQEEQQATMKIFKDTEVIKAPTPEQINISAEELTQLRETQKQFKEMQNERRDEILKDLFGDAEGTTGVELIQKYKKMDLSTVKQFKAFYDEVSPLISNRTKKAIENELQQKKEEENKKNKVNSNGRSASVQLRAEPKVTEEEQRTASSSKVDEVALLKKFMSNGGYS